MINCYDEYIYAKVTLIFGMVLAVPFLVICILGAIYSIAEKIKKKGKKDGRGDNL